MVKVREDLANYRIEDDEDAKEREAERVPADRADSSENTY